MEDLKSGAINYDSNGFILHIDCYYHGQWRAIERLKQFILGVHICTSKKSVFEGQ